MIRTQVSRPRCGQPSALVSRRLIWRCRPDFDLRASDLAGICCDDYTVFAVSVFPDTVAVGLQA
jgi:hypothetical protein